MADRRIPRSQCPHAPEMRVTESAAVRCARCPVTEHLRLCTSCGEVCCCESDNAHNREHFAETEHPIVVSHGSLPYRFTWCWVCNGYLTEQRDMSF